MIDGSTASRAPGAQKLRRDAALWSRVTRTTAIAVASLVALETLAPAISGSLSEGWGEVASRIVAALPAFVYLAALWVLQRGFADLGGGALFNKGLADALGRVGRLLVLGAALSVVGVPLLQRIFFTSPGYWVSLDAAAVAIGLLGAALTIWSRLMRRAERLERELQDII